MEHQDRLTEILDFWFGHVEETIAPSPRRARIWFAEDPTIDEEMRERFTDDLHHACKGKYNSWMQTARGQLGLILLLDQFTRHIYRDTPDAYGQDEKALAICLDGAQNEEEHTLSLIERVFYYFPLLHSEDIYMQEQSVNAYYLLSQYALEETQSIYDSFLKFANYHYDIIKRFGRFPRRNEILQRESNENEREFLAECDQHLEN
ncbi:MAG: DUF924 domain-containing protein [Coxiellaceae bacterium]|nr:DUF924 domain-containing protein [Coxiellaceae bacterium]